MKSDKKNILVFLAILAIALVLAGCGKQKNNSDANQLNENNNQAQQQNQLNTADDIDNLNRARTELEEPGANLAPTDIKINSSADIDNLLKNLNQPPDDRKADSVDDSDLNQF